MITNFKSTLKYKYILTDTYSYTTDKLLGIEYEGKWGIIKDSTITIYPGYAWDGCSIKVARIGNLYIGTPDGGFKNGKWYPNLTKYCSVVHDFLYQFNKEIPALTRSIADIIFYDRLKEEGFRLTNIYYKAVVTFGSIYWNK